MTDREPRLAMPNSSNDALSHAVALVATPVLLGLLGSWVDSWAGTGFVFAAVLAAFGVIGAFVSAYYRYEARMAEHDAGKPWTRRGGR